MILGKAVAFFAIIVWWLVDIGLLGIDSVSIFTYIILFLLAAILGFAHTVGEFGVVLMIGGNIPGETQVLSLVLFDHVESMDYEGAHRLAACLVAFSMVMLILVYSLNRQTLRFSRFSLQSNASEGSK